MLTKGMAQFLNFFVNLWLGCMSDLKPTYVPLLITDPTITRLLLLRRESCYLYLTRFAWRSHHP
jgi:hypothetical protein